MPKDKSKVKSHPFDKLKVTLSTSKGQKSKVSFLFHVSCLPCIRALLLCVGFLFLVAVLTGCNAVGVDKPAALQVTSTPEASVFLDGKHLGKTPFFSDQLRAGEHLLKITISDASYVTKVTLSAQTLTVVDRELAINFLAQSGEVLWLDDSSEGLFVTSLPQAADVTIDGKYKGKTALSILDIEEGDHKITLAKAGFINREFSIKTSNSYQLQADVTLASEMAKGIAKAPTPAPKLEVQKVEILKTPLGFLRVRSEPSLSATEIGRVKTGDQLEIIQEVKDWIKVSFEGKQGWISAQYTKKLP